MLDGEVIVAEVTSGDFCIAVYREDNAWEAEVLPVAVIEDLDSIIHALRQQPSIGGVIGLTAVGDDFFVITRVTGSHVSVFLSDLTASVDWPLARQVLGYLDIPVPYDEDLDQVLPAGDLSILADLGVNRLEHRRAHANRRLVTTPSAMSWPSQRAKWSPALKYSAGSPPVSITVTMAWLSPIHSELSPLLATSALKK